MLTQLYDFKKLNTLPIAFCKGGKEYLLRNTVTTGKKVRTGGGGVRREIIRKINVSDFEYPL